MTLCNVRFCLDSAVSKGWCSKHYQRIAATGDARPSTLAYRGLSAHERYRHNVERDANGYWIWTAYTKNGYGRFRIDNHDIQAHRYAYEYYVGEIPEDYSIDHCCRIRNCVDIRCLDVVPKSENSRRVFLTPEEHWALRPDRSVLVTQ